MTNKKWRGYACVALQRPKNSINVASAIRAAQIYEAAMIVTSGIRYRRVGADTMTGWRHLPLIEGVTDVFDHVPYDCVPVAVDIIEGARPLHEYTHPERAFYIFGPEDGTLGGDTVKRCRDVIYVPTNGCMNLAAAVNVVLYDRQAKQLREGSVKPNDNQNSDRDDNEIADRIREGMKVNRGFHLDELTTGALDLAGCQRYVATLPANFDERIRYLGNMLAQMCMSTPKKTERLRIELRTLAESMSYLLNCASYQSDEYHDFDRAEISRKLGRNRG